MNGDAPRPWCRLYADILMNSKIRQLSERDRWRFVALLALRCQGPLPKDDAIVALTLGYRIDTWRLTMSSLREKSLIIDNLIVGWDERQKHSDVSTERTRRFKDKAKGTVPDSSGERKGNGPEQNRTDKETESTSKTASMSADTEAVRLTELLKSFIQKNKPNFKAVETPGWLNKTSIDIERLHRLDGQPWEKIEAGIEWFQTTPPKGDFCWADNILSGAKLRKQFHQFADKDAKTKMPIKKPWSDSYEL